MMSAGYIHEQKRGRTVSERVNHCTISRVVCGVESGGGDAVTSERESGNSRRATRSHVHRPHPCQSMHCLVTTPLLFDS